ncbi:PREDICTED: E3 ubiquitin-protein ligase RNF19B-like isoform X2 [Pseudopodoces humilis]|uniref:E3 ubiquitin-protein ligase RNF19B-like isoform X2 n=1 Tax=Pseudopodoces humilis TaxID=181119 RepID=UPI0006B7D6C9|nr:PREDICTED: E3 ubiquitin-protein ligase RNF19B-like isoform X2 [Pseudopodoces humilis]
MVPLLPVVRLRRKPQTIEGETPPQPEPEPEEPEETRIVLALGESQALEECPLCLLPQPPEAFPSLASCSHRSCWACLERYLCLAVSESRVPVSCPHCPAALQPADVHRLLPQPALRDKYEEFLLRRLLVADPGTRWCPAPDCSYAVFAHGCAECPRLTCGREGCGTEFCYHCRQPWHPDGPCAPPAPSLATPTAQLAQQEELAHAEAEDIKVCPRCSAFIMKINDGSCNRMNCTVCGCLFCWLCLREISDMHFLSPSGCTFWGKRPWSRTRRIMWQLGMVLGAPMVISLAAGVAVPVITIGIPIYMGRKVLGQSRRSSHSGCQQCLSVTSSVLLSLFVSPIITALTVGVGVPLVLTYVYGTVVLSLCRSRWGCRGSRTPGDLGMVELDNLTKLNELWSVLPSPRPGEDGAPDPAASIPSSSRSPRPGPAWPEGDSQSASTVALAGSMLSEGQDTSDRLTIPSCPSLSPQEMRFVSWLTCTTSPAALGFPCDGVVPLAVPCTAALPFSRMNSTLLVLGCCLSSHSSVCPSPAQLCLLVPLTPFPGSLKLQLPTQSGGSAVSYSVLNCFLVFGVSRLGSCSPVRVWCFRASSDTLLQLDLLLRLFLCLGTLDELCVPLEQGCLRRLFICRSGFVLSATSTCCQVGLSQEHSGKGLLSTSHCLCAVSVLVRVTPD